MGDKKLKRDRKGYLLTPLFQSEAESIHAMECVRVDKSCLIKYSLALTYSLVSRHPLIFFLTVLFT